MARRDTKFFVQIFGFLLRALERNSFSFLFAAFTLCIVVLFLLPVPRGVLDILLACNILLSLAILLKSVFAPDASAMMSFPLIVVFTTLFRLALNVSSTRLILLHGDQGLSAAGRVIEAFGKIVVQGDFFVGAILFGVIAVVNFLVITKGAGRVAEVAARFTLDSLPGKQFAIDSDLRSGLISREEAQIRRQALAGESQFYGSMDGAMRFVQGDAIACFIIVLVNAIGGPFLGLQRGMGFQDAFASFGVLAIGDGLVSILPALFISVSAGVVVTNITGANAITSKSAALIEGLLDPQAMFFTSLGSFALSLFPGIPFLPFFFVGVCLLLGAIRMLRGPNAARYQAQVTGELLPHSAGGSKSEGWRGIAGSAPIGLPAVTVFDETAPLTLGGADQQPFDVLSVQVDAQQLLQLLKRPEGESALAEFYERKRAEIFRKRGLPLPGVHISADKSLPPGGYRVLVRERVIRSGQLNPDWLLAEASPSALATFAITVTETQQHPLESRTIAWVRAEPRVQRTLDQLSLNAYSIFEVLALEVLGAACSVVDEIFGVDEVKTLVSRLQLTHPQLAEEIFASRLISIPELTDILRRLVRESVSIRDLKLILEGVAEFSCHSKSTEDRQAWLSELHAFLRLVLARSILGEAIGPGEKLRTFTLSSEVEEEFRSAVGVWDGVRSRPPLEPQVERNLRAASLRMFQPVLERGLAPIVVVCPAEIRPAVQDFLSHLFPGTEWFRTVAFEELSGSYQTEGVGVLTC